jgi:hypothetical protein
MVKAFELLIALLYRYKLSLVSMWCLPCLNQVSRIWISRPNHSCFVLQTKRGQAAKGITAQEFKDFMTKAQDRLDEILDKNPQYSKVFTEEKPPLWSYDKASYHCPEAL